MLAARGGNTAVVFVAENRDKRACDSQTRKIFQLALLLWIAFVDAMPRRCSWRRGSASSGDGGGGGGGGGWWWWWWWSVAVCRRPLSSRSSSSSSRAAFGGRASERACLSRWSCVCAMRNPECTGSDSRGARVVHGATRGFASSGARSDGDDDPVSTASSLPPALPRASSVEAAALTDPSPAVGNLSTCVQRDLH